MMIQPNTDKLEEKGTYDDTDGYWVKEYGDNKTFFSRYDEGYRAIEKLYGYENNIFDKELINMNDEAKNEIEILLTMLKNTLMKNAVSMATDTEGNIMFFDTPTYVKTKEMKGFRIKIEDLVK